MRKADQLGQPDRAGMAALGEVQPGDPAAELVRQIARRPAHARAHVEHMRALPDAGLAGQDVDRLEAAEVVLVVALERGLGQAVERDAVPLQVVQDLPLVDRMGVVEPDDRSDARLFVRTHSGGGIAPVRSVIRP